MPAMQAWYGSRFLDADALNSDNATSHDRP